MKGNVTRGHYEGHGVFQWRNGATYVGDWLNDRRHGRGIFRSIQYNTTLTLLSSAFTTFPAHLLFLSHFTLLAIPSDFVLFLRTPTGAEYVGEWQVINREYPN